MKGYTQRDGTMSLQPISTMVVHVNKIKEVQVWEHYTVNKLKNTILTTIILQ